MRFHASLSVVIISVLTLAAGVAGAGEREFAVHLNRPGIAGEMTLVNAVKYRGVPSLKVQVKMQIPHYTPGDGAMGA